MFLLNIFVFSVVNIVNIVMHLNVSNMRLHIYKCCCIFWKYYVMQLCSSMPKTFSCMFETCGWIFQHATAHLSVRWHILSIFSDPCMHILSIFSEPYFRPHVEMCGGTFKSMFVRRKLSSECPRQLL